MRLSCLLCLIFLLFQLQSNASNNNRKLVGIAAYNEFGKDLFIGGIYTKNNEALAVSSNISESITSLEYRIVAERVSKSAFISQLWSWTNFSNTEFSKSDAAKKISEFSLKLKSSLYRGDSVIIELSDQSKSRILINNFLLVEAPTGELFRSIRNGWLGDNVPKRSFKESLLAGIDLTDVGRYSRLSADGQRMQEVRSWLTTKKTRAAKKAKVKKSVVNKNKVIPIVNEPSVAEKKLEEEKQLQQERVRAAQAKQLKNRQAEEKKKAQTKWKQYVSSVVKPLYSRVKYPKSASRRNIQGRVLVGIAFNDQGELVNVYVKEQSGFKILDKAALSAVGSSAPWPSPPEIFSNYFGDKNGLYTVSIPFSFVLNH
jgi:periplasmic protein TonB